jgi:hypothetical protein
LRGPEATRRPSARHHGIQQAARSARCVRPKGRLRTIRDRCGLRRCGTVGTAARAARSRLDPGYDRTVRQWRHLSLGKWRVVIPVRPCARWRRGPPWNGDPHPRSRRTRGRTPARSPGLRPFFSPAATHTRSGSAHLSPLAAPRRSTTVRVPGRWSEGDPSPWLPSLSAGPLGAALSHDDVIPHREHPL